MAKEDMNRKFMRHLVDESLDNELKEQIVDRLMDDDELWEEITSAVRDAIQSEI